MDDKMRREGDLARERGGKKCNARGLGECETSVTSLFFSNNSLNLEKKRPGMTKGSSLALSTHIEGIIYQSPLHAGACCPAILLDLIVQIQIRSLLQSGWGLVQPNQSFNNFIKAGAGGLKAEQYSSTGNNARLQLLSSAKAAKCMVIVEWKQDCPGKIEAEGAPISPSNCSADLSK